MTVSVWEGELAAVAGGRQCGCKADQRDSLLWFIHFSFPFVLQNAFPGDQNSSYRWNKAKLGWKWKLNQMNVVWLNQIQGVPDDAGNRQGRWSLAPSMLLGAVWFESGVPCKFACNEDFVLDCPLQLGLGIHNPSNLRLRTVFVGKPHWEMGGGRRRRGVGTWHTEFWITRMVWDGINETFFCCFPCCRWFV